MTEELQPSTPYIYTIIRKTWLSRRPYANAQIVTMLSLLVVALACFAQWNDFAGSAELWTATGKQVFTDKQFWRLWSTLFVHADLGHLLANSLLFYILGFFLYGYFGAMVFPTWALIMGGVTNAISLYTYPEMVKLVGASGVVSWMGGAWLILYFKLNTTSTRTARALRSLGVAIMLFAPSEAFDPKISYRTHAIGFLLGVAWGLLYYNWRRSEFMSAEVRETRVD